MRALTEKQVTAVLGAARKTHADYYPVLLCAFQTGMRLGELASYPAFHALLHEERP